MSAKKTSQSSLSTQIGSVFQPLQKNVFTPLRKTIKNMFKQNKDSIKELQSLEIPDNDVRQRIIERRREENEFLKKIERELEEDKKKEKERKQALQKASTVIRNSKQRNQRRLTALEKQEAILDTIKRAGIPVTTDARTLKKLPSPPRKSSKSTAPPPPPLVTEIAVDDYAEQMEAQIGDIPLVVSVKRRGGRRKTQKSKKAKRNQN